MEDLYEYDRCYECRGLGDDYIYDRELGELVCMCDDCPFNDTYTGDDYYGDDYY